MCIRDSFYRPCVTHVPNQVTCYTTDNLSYFIATKSNLLIEIDCTSGNTKTIKVMAGTVTVANVPADCRVKNSELSIDKVISASPRYLQVHNLGIEFQSFDSIESVKNASSAKKHMILNLLPLVLPEAPSHELNTAWHLSVSSITLCFVSILSALASALAYYQFKRCKSIQLI